MSDRPGAHTREHGSTALQGSPSARFAARYGALVLLGSARLRQGPNGSYSAIEVARDSPVLTVLRGSVQSGNGLLASRMRPHIDIYNRLAGTVLYPGSLNVLLDSLWTLPTDRLRIEPAELGVGVNLVRCRIFDQPAFVFRTDFHESWVEQHRLIEVLAAVRLRHAYALDDGDRVAIELSN